MPFFVLEPTAQLPRHVPPGRAETVPLGGVFVLPASAWDFEEDIQAISNRISTAPWAPIVLIEDTPTLPRGLGVEAPWVFAQAVDIIRVTSMPLNGIARPERLLEAARHAGSREDLRSDVQRTVGDIWRTVRARKPDHAAMGALIARRFDRALGEAIAAHLCGKSGAPFLARWCARTGLPSPRQWRTLHRLIVAVSLAQRTGWSQSAAAAEIGLAARSVSVGCRDYFGLSWQEAVSMLAWEGLLEGAIRRLGRL